MAPSPWFLIDRARGRTLAGILASSIGGIMFAVGVGIIEGFQAILDIIIVPLQFLAVNLGGVVDAFVGGGAAIIQQGAQSTISSIAPGATFELGPLTFALGIAAAALGLYVMSLVLAQQETSDLIPFSFTDVPFIGTEEEDED